MPVFQSFANLYLKLLLLSGVGFGLIMGLYLSLSYGIYTGMAAGIVTGVIFGFLLSLALFVMQVVSVKMMPYGLSEETLGVYQVRTLEMELPYEETFILCEASLGAVRGAKLRSEDRGEGRIDARTGINWKTFGDDISIDILRSDIGQLIRVVSRPTLMATIVDYGQNLENVEKIAGYLKAHGAIARR
jgi:hypothetical protein